MATLTLRVDFGEQRALGPGKIRLLELIDEHGSIAAAGRAMRMSYRRAWTADRRIEQCFGKPSITTQMGGQVAAAPRSRLRASPDREALPRHREAGRQAAAAHLQGPGQSAIEAATSRLTASRSHQP